MDKISFAYKYALFAFSDVIFDGINLRHMSEP